MKNIMYKAFLLIACSLCVLSCTDLDEEVEALNKKEKPITIDNQNESVTTEEEPEGEGDAFFVMNSSSATFYSLDYYQHIYCDHNGGAKASVRFENVPNWLTVKYNKYTHIMEIYNNHTSGSSTTASFDVIAVVKNLKFTKTVEVTNNFSQPGQYNTSRNKTKEYEVSANTKTLELKLDSWESGWPSEFWRKESTGYGWSYPYNFERWWCATSVGDSWITAIEPARVTIYPSSSKIVLTLQSNTTGADRTTEVRVYTVKGKTYEYGSNIYANYLIQTFNITQTAQ